MLSSITSMVTIVTPIDDKCLKIDSASGLLHYLRIIEIESGISFSNISIISKYYYQINITRPSTTFTLPLNFKNIFRKMSVIELVFSNFPDCKLYT